jgi:hypothetical protein
LPFPQRRNPRETPREKPWRVLMPKEDRKRSKASRFYVCSSVSRADCEWREEADEGLVLMFMFNNIINYN